MCLCQCTSSILPDSTLQSYDPNPGKQTQPHSEHWPFPLHRLGHLRTARTSWNSSSLLLSSISLLSHSFSNSGKVAFSHDWSSFSCRSVTHMASTWLIIASSNRRPHPNAMLEPATTCWHWVLACCSVRPEGVGHVRGESVWAAASWSSGKK